MLIYHVQKSVTQASVYMDFAGVNYLHEITLHSLQSASAARKDPSLYWEVLLVISPIKNNVAVKNNCLHSAEGVKLSSFHANFFLVLSSLVVLLSSQLGLKVSCVWTSGGSITSSQ